MLISITKNQSVIAKTVDEAKHMAKAQQQQQQKAHKLIVINQLSYFHSLKGALKKSSTFLLNSSLCSINVG